MRATLLLSFVLAAVSSSLAYDAKELREYGAAPVDKQHQI